MAFGRPADMRAIGAALAQPWADIVLSGATTTDQLRRGVAARPVPVADAEFERTAIAPDDHWRRRSERPWR